MTIIKRGFSNVHRTPRTDLRYLILISLSTSSVRSGRNFLKFSIYLFNNIVTCDDQSLLSYYVTLHDYYKVQISVCRLFGAKFEAAKRLSYQISAHPPEAQRADYISSLKAFRPPHFLSFSEMIRSAFVYPSGIGQSMPISGSSKAIPPSSSG